MKQTDFRDVPSVETYRASSSPVQGTKKWRQQTASTTHDSGLGSLQMPAWMPIGCATWLLRLKSTVHEHFQCWNKDSVMAEIFHIFLAEYEKKVSIDAQWQLWMAPCCKPRHALKNQRLRASGQPDRQNIKRRQDPSL